MPKLCPLHLRVSRGEVLRCLGYPRGKAPSARVEARLQALWSTALELLAPRGLYRLVQPDQAEALGLRLSGGQRGAGLGVCTVGPALERQSAACSARGAQLDALILDAIGSAAAEGAAEALHRTLCAEAKRLGLGHPRARRSPGYPGWDIACQPPLLAALGAEAIGVTLTAGLMMVPRKSVSFAAPLFREPGPEQDERRRCARCDLHRCAHRRAAADDDTDAEEPRR